jgi:hypothetical protein
MALPSTAPADFPIGLDIVTINSVAYIADSIDLATQKTRLIERQDENGDYAESQTRASGSAITGSLTLQKATTSTAFPQAGQTFTLDYDASGTPSTLEVMDVQASRSKDNADTFKIGVKLVTYQG